MKALRLCGDIKSPSNEKAFFQKDACFYAQIMRQWMNPHPLVIKPSEFMTYDRKQVTLLWMFYGFPEQAVKIIVRRSGLSKMGPIKTQGTGQPFGARAKDKFRHARKLRCLTLALIGSCNLKVSLAELRDYSRVFDGSSVFKPICITTTGERKTVSKVEKPVKSKK